MSQDAVPVHVEPWVREILVDFVNDLGFKVDKVHWQKNMNDMVCYLKAIKQDGYRR